MVHIGQSTRRLKFKRVLYIPSESIAQGFSGRILGDFLQLAMVDDIKRYFVHGCLIAVAIAISFSLMPTSRLLANSASQSH